MRDRRYVATHRGGPLSRERHQQLALWAAACAEHVLDLFTRLHPNESRPAQAIATARAWARGACTVGEARKASVAAHAAARDVEEGAARYVARACGHAVATAHMADHAPGAAIYALKAVQWLEEHDGESGMMAKEYAWQTAQLSPAINELVVSTLAQKLPKMGVYL